MRVNSINNQQYTNPAFGSFYRNVYLPTEGGLTQKVLHRNNTWLFRPSTEYWSALTFFLIDKYKNVPKVNIYDYACSSGHEAYSIVMQFISKLGVQKAEKFFPVIAKDYDEFVINMAKTGKFDLDPSEHNLINRVTCGNADDFVKLDHMHEYWNDENSQCIGSIGVYNATPLLKDRVNFSVANILDDYKNIKPDNSVVFARNFWPYLELGKQRELAENLYNHLGENSVLIIGDYERQREKRGEDTASEIERVGFRTIHIPNVYMKPAKQQPVQGAQVPLEYHRPINGQFPKYHFF